MGDIAYYTSDILLAGKSLTRKVGVKRTDVYTNKGTYRSTKPKYSYETLSRSTAGVETISFINNVGSAKSPIDEIIDEGNN